jgi:hypothetical protein
MSSSDYCVTDGRHGYTVTNVRQAYPFYWSGSGGKKDLAPAAVPIGFFPGCLVWLVTSGVSLDVCLRASPRNY